jgi:DNA ligase (NAD+)
MHGSNINNNGKIEKNAKVKEGECIFPFKYKHKLHDKCFETDKGEICATSINNNGTLQTYGYCIDKKKLTRRNNKEKQRKQTRRMDKKSKLELSNKKRLNENFIEILSKLEKLMMLQGEYFRGKAYQKAKNTIINIDRDIYDVNELKGKPGIGETILNKLKEYSETGKLKKLENEDNKPEYIFSEIFGIGPKKSKEIVEKNNIKSIEELRNNEDILNNVQKKGLKYYEDIQKRIPRSEIDEYNVILNDIFDSIKNKSSKMEIVGSYRRGAKNSGDIDIIITDEQNDKEIFEKFIEELIKRGIIIDYFSKGKNKMLGMSKIKDYTPRRIDLLYAGPNEYSFSVLYFTGSATFNTVMRQRALNMGYTMNEHGIYKQKLKIKGDKIDLFFPNEKSIFDFLDLVYKEPEERKDGRDIIVKKKTVEDALGNKEVIEEHYVNMNEDNEGSSKASPKKEHKKKNITLKKKENMSISTEKLLKDFTKEGIILLESLNEKHLSKMILLSNELYYNKDSILTDCQYDILKEYTQHKYPNNKVIKEVGSKVEKNKVNLPYYMGSMDKIKPDTEALSKWKEKYKGPYVISAKLDGISALYIVDESGRYLYTRGNGSIGQDISYLIPYLNIPDYENIVIRGELIMPKEVFEKKYKETSANARNLVSGIINQKKVEPEKFLDLDIVFYEVIKPELKPGDQMKLLKEKMLGEKTVINDVTTNITNEKLSNYLIGWREGYKYEIDGIIVTNDELYERKNKNPEHSFAFKMVLSDQIVEAKVLDVLWSPSKHGYLKPRIRIEPVNIGGACIEYATAFNAGFVEENKLGIGSVIELIRSGDVIPHIRKVITPSNAAKMPDVPYRWTETHVDIVLEESEKDETVLYKQITFFFTKLEVDGLSSGNVQRIINSGFDTIPKIIFMEKNDFLQVEGFKEKMATKIYNSIKIQLNKSTLPQLMAATNLFGRGMGEKRITLILNEYPNFLKEKYSNEERINKLMEIKGFAQKTAELFVNNLNEFLDFIEKAELQDKLHVDKPKKISSSHKLYEKNILFTGIRDKELEEKIKSVGGKIVSTISKNTDYLVVKNIDTDSSKALKAKELDIPILTISDFNKEFKLP